MEVHESVRLVIQKQEGISSPHLTYECDVESNKIYMTKEGTRIKEWLFDSVVNHSSGIDELFDSSLSNIVHNTLIGVDGVFFASKLNDIKINKLFVI